MLVRICKIFLIQCIGLFALIVAYNNLVDYQTNFAFVQHVLSMDTISPSPHLMERAITLPYLHHTVYISIILGEFVVALLCLAGSVQLVRKVRAGALEFNRAKSLAIAGLTNGFILWFFGFMTVGAEWFMMWQSVDWNGQESAFRFIVCIGIVLIAVLQDDKPLI
jgi:predicted small integral membrane protein